MGAYRLHSLKKRGWPTLPHSVGQCGPPPFFKKGAPRGPSQNFFPGRLIAMQKCHITSIVQNFKYKVYEKNLKKCSQMAHITPLLLLVVVVQPRAFYNPANTPLIHSRALQIRRGGVYQPEQLRADDFKVPSF